MPMKSSAVPVSPILFTTTAPPPVLTMAHIGRVSLKVTWPHVYGISEDIKKYRVTLNPGNVTAEVPGPNELGYEYTFTGLAMDYPYTVEVRGVNLNSSGGEVVGPPGIYNVRTLGEWADPPASGIDGWNGFGYTPGRTDFAYQHSGIFMETNEWAKNAVVNQGALTARGGATANNVLGMTWIEFNTKKDPDLLIRLVLMQAGHSFKE